MDMISGLRYEAERRKKKEEDAKAAAEAAARLAPTAGEREDENVAGGTDSKS